MHIPSLSRAPHTRKFGGSEENPLYNQLIGAHAKMSTAASVPQSRYADEGNVCERTERARTLIETFAETLLDSDAFDSDAGKDGARTPPSEGVIRMAKIAISTADMAKMAVAAYIGSSHLTGAFTTASGEPNGSGAPPGSKGDAELRAAADRAREGCISAARAMLVPMLHFAAIAGREAAKRDIAERETVSADDAASSPALYSEAVAVLFEDTARTLEAALTVDLPVAEIVPSVESTVSTNVPDLAKMAARARQTRASINHKVKAKPIFSRPTRAAARKAIAKLAAMFSSR